MKKLLLIAALTGGAFFTANAQLAFQYNGEDLANDYTLTYEGYTYESVPLIPGFHPFKVDPEIHLVSEKAGIVNVQTVSNVNVNLCAGSNCVNGTTNKKENVSLSENTPLNLQMDWVPGDAYNNDGSDVIVPAITVTITAWYVDDPSSKITLTVKMGGFTAGVESLTVDNANEINVTGRKLYYNVESASQIQVYSLSGKSVISQQAVGNGEINLSNLASGVYIYRLEGKNGKTGKFIIR